MEYKQFKDEFEDEKIPLIKDLLKIIGTSWDIDIVTETDKSGWPSDYDEDFIYF